MTALYLNRNSQDCLPDVTSPTCSHVYKYEWDEIGRLNRARRWDYASVNVEEPPATPAGAQAADLRYHYDSADQRVLKTALDPASTEDRHTLYVFETLELRRAEFDTTAGDYELSVDTESVYLTANGVGLARLWYEPDLNANIHDASNLRVLFTLGDHLGSTSAVLDKASSELVQRSTYQAYGGTESDYRPDRWNAFREDYRFTGKEEDVEVGLTYFGKRYLNTALQRWVSADPLEVHAPGEADANLYAYVSGKPLQNVDPLGLQSADAVGGAGPGPEPIGQGAHGAPGTARPERSEADAATQSAQEAGRNHGEIDAWEVNEARKAFETHVHCGLDSCAQAQPHEKDRAPTVPEQYARYAEEVAKIAAQAEAMRQQIPIPKDPAYKAIYEGTRFWSKLSGIVKGALGDQVLGMGMVLTPGGKGSGAGGPGSRAATGGGPKTPHTVSESRPPNGGKTGQPNSIWEQKRADGSSSVTYFDDLGRRFSREDYGQSAPHGSLPRVDGRTAPHEHRYHYGEHGPTGKSHRELDSNGKPVGPWIAE